MPHKPSEITHAEPMKAHAMLIMEQLITLLIRSGVGYGEFSSACKPVFYRQALREAERTGQKITDSSISLLSGLHRRDTASLRKAIANDPDLHNPPVSQPVSVPKQVIGLWLTQDIPETIAIYTSNHAGGKKDNISFESLVKQISKDQHPRSILTELERIGIVSSSKEHGTVTLIRNAFTPDPTADEARELLAQNVADHIAAGITNLYVDKRTNPDTQKIGVLEQAVFADELTQESISELHELANILWFNTLDTVLKRAIELCSQDEGKSGADQRFRLGMYAYHEHVESNPIETRVTGATDENS